MGDKAVDHTLVVRNMSMTFGGQRALDNVNLSIRRGEVHGLVGQNGCGKSTLIKILAGYHHPDPGGELEIDGRPIKLPVKTGSASQLGLSFVHQDLGLMPSLTVVENFRAWKLSTTPDWLIRWSKERKYTEEAFARFDLSLDPRAIVGDLPAVQRALLAIVRALDDLGEYTRGDDSRGGLLILDEPTVFLPKADRDRLFDVVRRSVGLGASVLFVSHDLDEALAVTDRVTVLRDGRVEGTVISADTDKDGLVELIIGKRLEAFAASHKPHALAEEGGHVTVAGATGVTAKRVSFSLQEGEILGLTGLLGSGFEEIPYLMFGALPAKQGRMRIAGHEYDLVGMSPSEAIKAGVAFVPADRQGSAGVGSLLVRDNVMLQVISRYGPYRLDRRRYLKDARAALHQYDVRPPQPLMDFQALSGGNQQKVILAKWLGADPHVLLVHEPTQGVDVGARLQVFETITQAAAKGMSVVCASSDYEQLAAICDRVLVFHDGEIMCDLVGDDISKDRITEQCYMSAKAPRPGEDTRKLA
jgi:ribose transport system ATP-binding protein